MTLDHQVISDRIEAIIRACPTVEFLDVYCDEPSALPLGGPYAAFWPVSRDAVVQRPAGTVEIEETWTVMAWWPHSPERSVLKATGVAMPNCAAALHVAFRADATLGGALSPTLRVGPASYGFDASPVYAPANLYRALRFELYLPDYEGERTIP